MPHPRQIISIFQCGAFQPTDRSAGLWYQRCHPAPCPFCVGTDLRVLLPLGSPAMASQQRPAEPRWGWAVGQVPAGWVQWLPFIPRRGR